MFQLDGHEVRLDVELPAGSPREDFTYATPETVVNRGDVIIASGKTNQVEHFSDEG